MKKKKMTKCIIAIVIVIIVFILTCVLKEIYFRTTPIPEWVDVEFDNFQPHEGYIIFKKDGYVHISDQGDEGLKRYRYNKSNNTIFIGSNLYKVISFEHCALRIRRFKKETLLSCNGSRRHVASVEEEKEARERNRKYWEEYNEKREKTNKEHSAG